MPNLDAAEVCGTPIVKDRGTEGWNTHVNLPSVDTVYHQWTLSGNEIQEWCIVAQQKSRCVEVAEPSRRTYLARLVDRTPDNNIHTLIYFS